VVVNLRLKQTGIWGKIKTLRPPPRAKAFGLDCGVTSAEFFPLNGFARLQRSVIFARRVQQFRLHLCSAPCRLEKLAVPHRPYKARRRALRLSRMLHSQYSRRRLACPGHLAAQRDPVGPLRREGPAVPAVPPRLFPLLCPAIPPAQSPQFRPGLPRDLEDQGGRPRPFGLAFPAVLPVPAVRFPHANRRRPAVPAVPIHPFPRSFLGVQRGLEDLPYLPARVARKHLGHLPPLGARVVPEAPARQQDPGDQQPLGDRPDLVIQLDRRDQAIPLRPFHLLVPERQPDLADLPRPLCPQRLAGREVLLGRQGRTPDRNKPSAKTPIVKEETLNACDYLPASVHFETSIGNSPRVKAFRACQKSLVVINWGASDPPSHPTQL
jgi:hypothetical protein